LCGFVDRSVPEGGFIKDDASKKGLRAEAAKNVDLRTHTRRSYGFWSKLTRR
jgi:hypothetical protein